MNLIERINAISELLSTIRRLVTEARALDAVVAQLPPVHVIPPNSDRTKAIPYEFPRL